MAGGAPPPTPAPKILLTKPHSASVSTGIGGVGGGGGIAGRREHDSASDTGLLPSRNYSQAVSLSLLSPESWDLHIDRVLPFLTENSDFVVIGVIGPPGIGKSMILNELYGYDKTSPGMILPFATQTDEMKVMAKNCTSGIEFRVSDERLILLDTQPVFSASILADMIKPDGSCAIPVLSGEILSPELSHELMTIQMAVFLASVCNVLLVVSEGIHDLSMWQLMLTVDLLKHNIPDPSHGLNFIQDKENSVNNQEEYLSDLVFVHSKVREQDLSPPKTMLLKKALFQYFKSSSFISKVNLEQDLFLIPVKSTQESSIEFESSSYSCMLGLLRDKVLSMNGRSFSKNISERDWLKSAAKIWELVKKSPVITDYCRTLQDSGQFRK
ncbi:hypothetical protein LUZ60_007306 [Juncus effusus]|nr:hypothetical protein LUZ60_007306 [Juncus effusus]